MGVTDYYTRIARSRERAVSGYRPFVSVWIGSCRCGWTALFDGADQAVAMCGLCDDAGLTWTVATMPAVELPAYVEWFEQEQTRIRAERGLSQWQLGGK